MVQQKEIIWTSRAQREKEKILDYWVQKNKSVAYSQKLDKLIQEALQFLKIHPKIGRKTDYGNNIRVKFVKDYEIFYQLTQDTIYILSIWDNRRNPKDFEL